MNRRSALSLIALACSVAACASMPEEMQQLSELMAGNFDTAATTNNTKPADRFIDSRTRIQAPSLGEHVFYQQLRQGGALKLYRQRIVVFSERPGGSEIISHSYALRSPEGYVDATAADFEHFSTADIVGFMSEGCEQVWTRTDDGFRGYVNPESCKIVSSRTGKLRTIESVNILAADSLQLVERGFDAATGQQLFGTPQGQTLTLGRTN